MVNQEEFIKQKKQQNKKIRFLYGTRYKSALFYSSRLRMTEDKEKNLENEHWES